MLRFALLLRYTPKQAYKLLLCHFPLPSTSLLKKLKQGIEPLKAVKLLLANVKVGKDIILLPVEVAIKESVFAEREAAEHILRLNKCAKLFFCNEHIHWDEKFVNRML